MPRYAQPPLGSDRTWPVLSELGNELVIVHCEICRRMGKRRASALLSELGDLNLPEVAVAMARAGGCVRALNPPSVADFDYNSKVCQARRLSQK